MEFIKGSFINHVDSWGEGVSYLTILFSVINPVLLHKSAGMLGRISFLCWGEFGGTGG